MDDDELLRRFAALKGSPSPSTPINPNPSALAGPSRHITTAARRAQQEDEDLARIADGQPLDLGVGQIPRAGLSEDQRGAGAGADSDPAAEPAGEILWNDVKGEYERRKEEDGELMARLKGLGGERWATITASGSGNGNGQGDDGFGDLGLGDGDGDDEVRLAADAACGLVFVAASGTYLNLCHGIQMQLACGTAQTSFG